MSRVNAGYPVTPTHRQRQRRERLSGLKEQVKRALAEQQEQRPPMMHPVTSTTVEPSEQYREGSHGRRRASRATSSDFVDPRRASNAETMNTPRSRERRARLRLVKERFEGKSSGKPQAFAVMDIQGNFSENNNAQLQYGSFGGDDDDDNKFEHVVPPPRHRLPSPEAVPQSSSLWASRRAAFEAPATSPPKQVTYESAPSPKDGTTAAELAEISRQGQKELRKRQHQQYLESNEKERSARWEERTAAFQNDRTPAFVDKQRRPLEQQRATRVSSSIGSGSGVAAQHSKQSSQRSASMGAVQIQRLAAQDSSQRRSMDPSLNEAMERINRPALQPDDLQDPPPPRPSVKEDGALVKQTAKAFVQNSGKDTAKIPEMFQRAFGGLSAANHASTTKAASPGRKVVFSGEDVHSDARPSFLTKASRVGDLDPPAPQRQRQRQQQPQPPQQQQQQRQQQTNQQTNQHQHQHEQQLQQKLQQQLDSSTVALRGAEATAGDLARRLEDALGREDELVRQLTSANEEHELNHQRMREFKEQQEELQATVVQVQGEIKRVRRTNDKLEEDAKKQKPIADASSTHSPKSRGGDSYAEIINGHASAAKAAREDAAAAHRQVAELKGSVAKEKEAAAFTMTKLEEKLQRVQKEAEVLRVELRLASAAFEGREAVASAEFEALTRKCEAAEGRAEKASDAARTAAAERDAESKAGSRAQSEAEEAKAAATRAVESARRAEATEFDLQAQRDALAAAKAQAEARARSTERQLEELQRSMAQLARGKEEAQQSAEAAKASLQAAELTARHALQEATTKAATQAARRAEKDAAQATQRKVDAAVAAALTQRKSQVDKEMGKLSKAVEAAQIEALHEAQAARQYRTRAEAAERQRNEEGLRQQQRANGDLEAALVDAKSALKATCDELDRAAQEKAASNMREAEALARISSLQEQLAAKEAQPQPQQPQHRLKTENSGGSGGSGGSGRHGNRGDPRQAQSSSPLSSEALARISNVEEQLMAAEHQQGSASSSGGKEQQRNDQVGIRDSQSSSPSNMPSRLGTAAQQPSPRQAVHQALRQAAIRRGASDSSSITVSPSSGGEASSSASSSSALGHHSAAGESPPAQQPQKSTSSRRWGSDAFNNHEPVPLASNVPARMPPPPSYIAAQPLGGSPASAAVATAPSPVRRQNSFNRTLSDSGWIKTQVAESPVGSNLERAVAAVAQAHAQAQAQDAASPRESLVATFEGESVMVGSPPSGPANNPTGTAPSAARPITPESDKKLAFEKKKMEMKQSLTDFMSRVPADKVRRTGTTPEQK